jgi:hypothetical protein
VYISRGSFFEEKKMRKQKKFVPWKKFLIARMTREEFLEKLALVKDIRTISDKAAQTLIEAFSFQGVKENIRTTILTPADLGYEYSPAVAEFFDPERLNELNLENVSRLPSGYVVDFLPLGSNFFIAGQIQGQPKGEILRLATEQVDVSGLFGYGRIIFGAVNHGSPFTSLVDPDDRVLLTDRFIFRLRKIA